MRTFLLTAAAIVGGLAAVAQDAPATAPADTQQFTLQQAQAYALENNFQNQRSVLEVEQARKQIAEVRAIGLPQINGEVRVQNYLDIPTSRALATAFDPNAPEGELAEFQFGLQYNNALGVTINQVVFDGSYIVALQSANTFQQLSVNNLEKTEIELKEEVAQAYYTALVAIKSMEVLQESMGSTKSILDETRATYEVGLEEEQSVDQLELTVNELEVAIGIAEGQTEFAAKLLKLQMGMDINTPIKLTDDLDAIVASLAPSPDPREFKVAEHIDFRITETNQELSRLTLKNEKFSYLPKLDLFFNHEQQNISNTFDAFTGGKYFPSTLLGATLQVPIWSSGSRAAKVSQAKVDLEKSIIDARETEQNLLYQAQLARSNYETDYAAYENQLDNLALSKKIYDKTVNRFKEGVATSLELAQAQRQYLDTEREYISSILDILTSRSELSKSYGTK